MGITRVLLVVPFFGIAASSWAVGERPIHGNVSLVYQQHIRRNYHDTSRYIGVGRGIVLEGTAAQVARLTGWLDTIATVPYGRHTLRAIFNSTNQVTIRHSTWALTASGRTLAPLSDNLTNGRGEDVLILFDVRIPEQGSHHVFDSAGRPLEFTAVENLFHELAHARHQTNGDWRYWDSEGQAIEDENRFRVQYAPREGRSAVSLRSGIEGQQTWWPASSLNQVAW
jgi:hypothetical protein